MLDFYFYTHSVSYGENSGVFPVHSACTVSRRLINLLGFMLSAVKIFVQSKYCNPSSPSSSVLYARILTPNQHSSLLKQYLQNGAEKNTGCICVCSGEECQL